MHSFTFPVCLAIFFSLVDLHCTSLNAAVMSSVTPLLSGMLYLVHRWMIDEMSSCSEISEAACSSSVCVMNLKFHGSSFPRSILVTSSQGCHEDATRKKVPWNLHFMQ